MSDLMAEARRVKARLADHTTHEKDEKDEVRVEVERGEAGFFRLFRQFRTTDEQTAAEIEAEREAFVARFGKVVEAGTVGTGARRIGFAVTEGDVLGVSWRRCPRCRRIVEPATAPCDHCRQLAMADREAEAGA